MGEVPDISFHHGGISVPDLDDAIEWYGRVLGFELEKKFYIEAAKSKTALVKRGDIRFELFEVEGAKPLPDERRHPPSDLQTHGNKHVAFKIESLDLFLKHARSVDADIAFVVDEDFGRSCFLRDCAGNLIEFLEE